MAGALTEKSARRVLLVDDEERFVLQLGKLLKARDFEVATAGNGLQALVLMETRCFDVVVLDLRMPVMDGMTTLVRIQAKTPAPAVIMLTGHATVESGIEAIRGGAFDYLVKPCSIEELVAKLNLACRAGQIRRRPVLWPRSMAGELVLDAFRRVEDTDPLLEAVSTFNHRLPRMAGETLYIVDRDGRLSGHLSKSVLIGRAVGPQGDPISWVALSANLHWLPDVKVGDVMNPDTLAVEPATPLKEVAEIMMARGFQTVPVTDESRRVIGVIRLKDVLAYLENDGRKKRRSDET